MYTLRACMTVHGFEIMFPFNVHTINDLWRDVDEHGGSMWFMRIFSQPSRMDGNCMKAIIWICPRMGYAHFICFWKMVINIDLTIMCFIKLCLDKPISDWTVCLEILRTKPPHVPRGSPTKPTQTWHHGQFRRCSAILWLTYLNKKQSWSKLLDVLLLVKIGVNSIYQPKPGLYHVHHRLWHDVVMNRSWLGQG